MKAKGPILLAAFVLLVIVLVLGIVGVAVAAPATAVKGSLTFVSWGGDPGPFIPDAAGNLVISDQVLTWAVAGDLVGTYVLNATFYSNIYRPPYRIVGTATFTGTLNGKPCNWSATVRGSGKMHAGYEFAGKQRWKSTLISPMDGQITIRDRFGHEDGTDYTAYTGVIK